MNEIKVGAFVKTKQKHLGLPKGEQAIVVEIDTVAKIIWVKFLFERDVRDKYTMEDFEKYFERYD